MHRRALTIDSACVVQSEDNISAAWNAKPPCMIYELSRSTPGRAWIIGAQDNLDRKTQFKAWIDWMDQTGLQFAASPTVGELVSADLHFQGDCSEPMRESLILYGGPHVKKFQDAFLVAVATVTRGALESWYGGLTFVDVVPAGEGDEPLEPGRQPRTPFHRVCMWSQELDQTPLPYLRSLLLPLCLFDPSVHLFVIYPYLHRSLGLSLPLSVSCSRSSIYLCFWFQIIHDGALSESAARATVGFMPPVQPPSS